MRKPLLLWGSALGLAVTLSSCVTDPYYTSGGGSYQSSYVGYGDGYGYGNPGFSTSLFVSTGDSRWGYDPSCYSYYDYHRRCYYDPYLYGYYPSGYRPPVIVGCPHPYGWRPGRGYCPPPNRIRNVTVVNYRNRESSYRNLNHSWSRNVRAGDGNRSNQGSFENRPPNRGMSSGSNQQGPASWKGERAPSANSNRGGGGFGNSNMRNEGSAFRPNDRNATLPRTYNQPVINPPTKRIKDSGSRSNGSDPRLQTRELRGLGQAPPERNPGFATKRGGPSQPKTTQARETPKNLGNRDVRQPSSNNDRKQSDEDRPSGGKRGGFR